MQPNPFQRGTLRQRLMACVATAVLIGNSLAPALAATGASASNDGNTASPIKHVIVIIGENRSFDHVFATYKPAHSTDTVLNLLSEGIVNANGNAGPELRQGYSV